MRNSLFIFFMLCCSLVFAEPRIRPPSWAKLIIGTELDNFYLVDIGIYRSEQPDDENFTDLSKLGISEILNLRDYHSDNEAKEHHFKVSRVKMDAYKVTTTQLLESLKIIKNRKAPILVHCWHGSDRTGVTIAAYRMIFQNWTKDQAIDEMLNGGYGYHSFIFPDLLELLKNLNVVKMKMDLGLNNKMNDG